jgi:signal transduction histidine kinase
MKPLGREDKIRVQLFVSESTPEFIITHVVKLQQAFFNILSNAFKYTKGNYSVITLSDKVLL